MKICKTLLLLNPLYTSKCVNDITYFKSFVTLYTTGVTNFAQVLFTDNSNYQFTLNTNKMGNHENKNLLKPVETV